MLTPQELLQTQIETLELCRKKVTPHQLAALIREANEAISPDESTIPPELVTAQNRFREAPEVKAIDIKRTIKTIHGAMLQKARQINLQHPDKNFADILKLIAPGCAFERYIISHIDEGENVKSLMFNFCQYALKILTEKNERFEELMSGFPPSEEECLPGTSGRIALLIQTRFCSPKNVTLVNAYTTAKTRLTTSAQTTVPEGEHTHIPSSIDWQLALKTRGDLLKEDKFFKLPFSQMSIELVAIMEENFRDYFWQNIESDMSDIEQYIGEFSLPTGDDLTALELLLSRYGIEIKDAYEEIVEDNEYGKFKLTTETATKLLENAFGFLTKFKIDQKDYQPLIAKEEFPQLLNLETGKEIARALNSADDEEFLSALKFLCLFGSGASPTFSPWQFMNICSEFLKENHLLSLPVTLKQRLQKIGNIDRELWLERIEEQIENSFRAYGDQVVEQYTNGMAPPETDFKHLKKRIANGSNFDERSRSYILKNNLNIDHESLCKIIREPRSGTKDMANIFNQVIGNTTESIQKFLQRPGAKILLDELLNHLKSAFKTTSSYAKLTLEPEWKPLLGTILSNSIALNKPQIFERILENKLLPNGNNLNLDLDREIPGLLIHYNRKDFVPLLAKSGFDKRNILDLTDNKNAIHRAAISGRAEIIGELTREFNLTKEELNLRQRGKSADRYNAVELAIIHNHPGVISALKDDISFAKEDQPHSLFHLADKKERNACLKTLLSIAKDRLDDTEKYPEGVTMRTPRTTSTLKKIFGSSGKKSADVDYCVFELGLHTLDNRCKFTRWARKCGGDDLLEELRESKKKAEDHFGIVANQTSGIHANPSKSANLPLAARLERYRYEPQL